MTVDNPAPNPFPTVTVRTDSGDVVVPCEPVNEWLAVVGGFGMGGDGQGRLSGRFGVVHRSRGLAITEGGGCITCARHAGAVLAATGIDWQAFTVGNTALVSAGWTDRQKMLVASVRAVWWICDAEQCDERGNVVTGIGDGHD